MTMQSETPLPQIRLEILPEVPNRNSNALANAIGRELFDDLKNQGYRIEPAYTGELGGNDFLIWLSQLAPTAGAVLTAAVGDAIVGKGLEKVADVLRQMFEKMKTSKHKALPVTMEVKSPHNAQIEAHGSFVQTIETLISTLQELQKQPPKNDGEQQTTEITVTTTITIKISNSQTRNDP